MSILVQELDCREGVVGVITLDSPATLNALTLDMVDGIQAALDSWAADSRVCLVLLQGNGERGFCAGGNLRELYNAMAATGDGRGATDFFSREYRLDFTLHRYPKPVIGWAHGIIMGGGLGLLSGCRYRLITPDAVVAMPETRIGLFPDTGASWFLNRLPEGIGLFLGLTGARLNATDTLRIGLADLAVHQDGRDTLLAQLQEQRWSGDVAADDNRLYRLLNQLDTPAARSLPASELAGCEQAIGRTCHGGDLPELVASLLAEADPSPWWQACMTGLREACPTSLWLVHEQLERARQMSLKDIFEMEMVVAANCVRNPDFREGIRARLIERDNRPAWRFDSLSGVAPDVVTDHFIAPWPAHGSPLDLP